SRHLAREPFGNSINQRDRLGRKPTIPSQGADSRAISGWRCSSICWVIELQVRSPPSVMPNATRSALHAYWDHQHRPTIQEVQCALKAKSIRAVARWPNVRWEADFGSCLGWGVEISKAASLSNIGWGLIVPTYAQPAPAR